MSYGVDELRSLVRPDRIHRRVYSDPGIFELEMDRIFGRAWIYVAHESQLKRPGDFVRGHLGREDVIVTRHTDGQIYVLHNRCAHRGARICTDESGHAKSFTCPYHAWSFRTDGSLEAVLHRKSYPENFSFDDPRNHLLRAPRVSSYRGFIFASLAPTGPSLTEFLGGMTESFDNLVDRAPDGDIEISPDCFRVVYRGNWKMHNENINDCFHPSVVHSSSVSAGRTATPRTSSFDDDLTREQLNGNSFGVREWEELHRISLPRGHSFGGGFYQSGVLAPKSADPVRAQYREKMIAKYGAERTDQVLGLDRFNSMIYPAVNINAQYQQLRLVTPLAVNRTMVTSYCFRLKGAPDEIFARAVRFLTNLGSPASMIFTDDTAVFARCQMGLSEGGHEWVECGRGLGKDQKGPDGRLFAGPTEVTQRGQHDAWLQYMTAEAS